jgi:hypothetical protein
MVLPGNQRDVYSFGSLVAMGDMHQINRKIFLDTARNQDSRIVFSRDS